MENRSGALAMAAPEALRTSRDAHLRTLVALVDSGAFDVLSLDVFDTLVWRKVPRPTDVFLLLAHDLRARGWLPESASVESFARERQLAEERVRLAHPARECTLLQVWEGFPSGFLTEPVAAARLAEVERACERRLVRPDPAMVALARHAQASGLRLVLVSDTYFSAGDLRAFTGLAPDRVFASCECGRGKAAGLHAEVPTAMRVPPGRVLHVGDHPVADFEAAQRAGVAAYHRPRFPEGWEEPLAREWGSTLDRRAQRLPVDDGGWCHLRARAMHESEDDHEAWGAGVLGPVLASFGEWVAERARAVGAGSVLCLMREGRLLRAVLAETAPDLAAQECFVSRFVALRAAAAGADEDGLRAFLERPSPPRVGRVLEQLGLAPDAVPGFAADSRLDPARVGFLARHIARDRDLAGQVRAACGAARAGLLAHLDTLTGGRREGTLAVVDLGYTGTIQAALHRVLAEERPRLRLHGLYLVTGGRVSESQRHGAILEGWLAQNAQPVRVSHTFMRSPEVVEQAMMADLGTTLGHDPDGTPRLAEHAVPEPQRLQIAAVQRGVLAFARRWRPHRAEHGAAPLAVRREWCRAIVERAIARPSAMELELFAGWSHDENLGSGRVRTLAEPTGLRRWEEEHLSAHQLASLPSAALYWPSGYAHRRSRALGEAVAALFLRQAGPEGFESAEPEVQVAFYWDTGRGWSSDAARVDQVPLASHGRRWHRLIMSLRDEVHARYAFSVGLPGDLVRWAGVRIRAEAPDGAVREWEFAGDALQHHGLEPLAGAWSVVRGDPSLVTTPELPLGRFTGTVTVDAFFGWAKP